MASIITIWMAWNPPSTAPCASGGPLRSPSCSPVARWCGCRSNQPSSSRRAIAPWVAGAEPLALCHSAAARGLLRYCMKASAPSRVASSRPSASHSESPPIQFPAQGRPPLRGRTPTSMSKPAPAAARTM